MHAEATEITRFSWASYLPAAALVGEIAKAQAATAAAAVVVRLATEQAALAHRVRGIMAALEPSRLPPVSLAEVAAAAQAVLV
jgi:hypothetical protein